MTIIYSCKNDKPTGVWMSSNNRIHDLDRGYESLTNGFVIDFNNNNWSHLFSDSSIKKFKIDNSKSLLKLKNDSLKINYTKYNNDSIEIEYFENITAVFRPLNLSFKIEKSKQQILDLLTNTKFENIKDSINIDFKLEFHQFDKTGELRNLRGKMYGRTIYGFWFLGECQNNYFLTFAIDDSEPINIYQIKSINSSSIELLLIQETDMINRIKNLKPVYNNVQN
ncbi:hypothetical protein [Lutibacter oricola]|uniref:hypothetical protein n=1 Tax=Lutibacter oricola TaxID=762486 RepID=UPI0011143C8F|nr:hypothetical protein [Lutibacter oricola]